MSSTFRVGFRAARAVYQRPVSHTARFTQRRLQSTTADASKAAENGSAFSKLWNSPVGPKTVHFWAPIMKWGLVLAGAADFARPADQLSISQNGALMATGLIWTRWCFIIKPQNLFLASVNFLLFCVGATQVTRVVMHQRSVKGEPITDLLKQDAKDEGKNLEQAAEKVEQKA